MKLSWRKFMFKATVMVLTLNACSATEFKGNSKARSYKPSADTQRGGIETAHIEIAAMDSPTSLPTDLDRENDGLLAGAASTATSPQAEFDESKNNEHPTAASEQVITGDLPDPCSEPLVAKNFETLISFPDSRNCKWAKNGNLRKRDGHISARTRLDVPVDVGAISTICSLALESLTDTVAYDDFLFLLAGDTVLFSASSQLVENFSRRGPLRLWDWQKIAGLSSKRARRAGSFCPTDSLCEAPPTDRKGPFSLRIGHETLRLVFNQAQENDSQMVFSAIATGDDDPGDCQMSGLTLQLSIRYH
jgi:hypothetical protein